MKISFNTIFFFSCESEIRFYLLNCKDANTSILKAASNYQRDTKPLQSRVRVSSEKKYIMIATLCM